MGYQVREWYQYDHRRTLNFLEASNALMRPRYALKTLFNVADMSKAFLSASLGIVIDDFACGRNTTPLPAGLSTLNWKTKVADILPNDWKLMDPWASEKANLIDILTHVSGVERWGLRFHCSAQLQYLVLLSVKIIRPRKTTA